jgi:hypothetical protein
MHKSLPQPPPMMKSDATEIPEFLCNTRKKNSTLMQQFVPPFAEGQGHGPLLKVGKIGV